MSTCLRCAAALDVSGEAGDVTFLRCPGCHRAFTRHPDGVLVERWPGPLGVALYGVIFSAHPGDPAVAQRIATQMDHLDTGLMVREIRWELTEPTQPVHRILPGMRAGEDDLRGFLALLADALEQRERG